MYLKKHPLIFLPIFIVSVFTFLASGYTFLTQNNSIVRGEETKISLLTQQLLDSTKSSQTDILSIALQRKTILMELAQTNPQEFLKQATLFNKRSSFPPEVQSYIEEEKNAEGILTLIHIDHIPATGEANLSKTAYTLETKDQEYNLSFVDNPPEVLSGSSVKTKGIAIDKELVMQTGEFSASIPYSLQVINKATTNSTGPQETLIMLVKFNDTEPEIITKQKLAEIFFDRPPRPYPPLVKDTIDEYYQMNSYNQISFPGSINNIYGWYNINQTRGICHQNYKNWSRAAKNIATNLDPNDPAYINPARFQDPNLRIVYIFNIDEFECQGYNGFGTLGGAPSETWITSSHHTSIGGYIAHELGHNIGLHHANALFCGTITYTKECAEVEYGDPYDVMGDLSATGRWKLHFNGSHKATLGWLGGGQVQEASTSGIYTIKPLASATPGVKVIKIKKPDTQEYYYVSYRQPLNYDSMYIPETITRGVSIHISDGNPKIQSKLLDATPNSFNTFPPYRDYREFTDSSLYDNGQYYDPINRITFKQLSHNADEVKIQLEIPGLPLNESIGSWENTQELPNVQQGHGVVKVNDYIFSIGGGINQGSPLRKNIYRTKIKTDGSLEAWTTLPSQSPDGNIFATVVSHNNYIYIVSGYNQFNSNTDKVYYTKVLSDGSLDTWQETTALPQALGYLAGTILNNKIIVSGGINASGTAQNSIFAATIQSDGTLGNWTQIGTLPEHLQKHSMVINNDFMYIIGGSKDYSSQIIMYSAKIDESGTIQPWKKFYMPTVLTETDPLVFNNQLFLFGGNTHVHSSNTQLSNNVYRFDLPKNGDINNPTVSRNLPTLRSASKTIMHNNKIYLIGGKQDANTAEKTVFSSTLQLNDLSIEKTSRDKDYYKMYICNKGTFVSNDKFLVKALNKNTGKEFTSNPNYPYSIPPVGQCIWTGGITCNLIGSNCNDTVTVQFDVDPSNKIQEISETNNQKTQSFTGTNPDLTVEQITRDSQYYKAYMCNRGNVTSPSTFTLKLTNSSNGKSFVTNPNYPFSVPQPGQCAWTGGITCGLIGTTCTDKVIIKATVDDSNKVVEVNEGNNEMSKTFSSSTQKTGTVEIIIQPDLK